MLFRSGGHRGQFLPKRGQGGYDRGHFHIWKSINRKAVTEKLIPDLGKGQGRDRGGDKVETK